MPNTTAEPNTTKKWIPAQYERRDKNKTPIKSDDTYFSDLIVSGFQKVKTNLNPVNTAL